MTDISAIDTELMARALRLAERGLATARPNPVVGCVVVASDGQVVGDERGASLDQFGIAGRRALLAVAALPGATRKARCSGKAAHKFSSFHEFPGCCDLELV